MDKFAENIKNLCEAAQPYGYIAAIVAILTIGVMLAIPSEKAHEKAKAAIPWVIIGVCFINGAIYIGTWISTQMAFQ